MTIKRLILPVALLAGFIAPAKAQCPMVPDALVGLGTVYALEQSDAKLGVLEATVFAAMAGLVNKHGAQVLPAECKAITGNITRAALVVWIHTLAKAIASNDMLEGNVRALPLVGSYLADALFSNAALKARLVALAAAVSPTVKVPGLN